MSDLASPLLVTMNDEAHAYICFCALMQRLSTNFMIDGIAMTQKFTHLAEGLMYYDPEFYNYLKIHQVKCFYILKNILDAIFHARKTTCKRSRLFHILFQYMSLLNFSAVITIL